MEDLPEELLSSILSRLSVIDLLRSKATCSRWNSLISSPSFARKHAEREKSSWDIIMDLFHRGIYMVVGRDFLLNGQPYLNKFSWNGKSYDSCGYSVLGVCNGLVCLHLPYVWSKVLVWNPATREISKVRHVFPLIDEVSLSVGLPLCYQDHLGGEVPHGCYGEPLTGFDFFIFGFGYDHQSDDYKILTMHESGVGCLCSLRSSLVKPILQKDLPWKAINLRNRYALYLKGMLHWSLLNSDNSLVYFALKDEAFVRTQLLPEGLTASPTWLGLGVVEDCLCICVQLIDHSCEVWIMKEYGVRSSWTRLLKSNDSSFGLTPLVGRPDGQVLFSENTPCFAVYNPRECTMTRGMTYVKELSSIEWFFCVPWEYKESMISPRELFSVKDTSCAKQLSGVPDQSRIKGTSGVKIILHPELRIIDCDSLLNGQLSARRCLWMGESNERHSVVGSCNGLVLLKDYHKHEFLWLWNPTTREVRKIRNVGGVKKVEEKRLEG
ncbi:hypothetical protein MLD38_029170 [Melastoma candidum]|uniref:Uncharacterized protein n=1 Tax=Melastoma candidum TaxID=119954 RepID=A0ACB9N5L6_9MYRT|nr:hypothetical protein MLD38_029170 [Melastoma candidum]